MKTIAIIILTFFSIQTTSAQKEKTYTTREIYTPIIIDGNIDEKSWNKVKWEGNFIQTEPKNGKKPTYDTRFKILYDQNNLYVAIRAFDKRPDNIVVSNKPRDFFDGDYVEINIDSDFDRKDAFSFTITAGGIRGDEHIKTSKNWFNDWNPNWIAKTRIDNKGWIAEMKIPLSELEIHTKEEHWGIQVNRSLERLDEGSSWTTIPDEDKWVEYFGLLKGIENIPVSKGYSSTDKINSKLLKKDFSLLYHSLKSSYPSLSRYHSLDYIEENYNESVKVLEKESTLLEYYKIIASFVSKIGDGHMKVELPDDFSNAYSKGLRKLPFKIKTTGDIAFITENYTQDNVLNDAQIISINGKSIQKITGEIADLIPSDGYNTTGKYYRISNDFNFYYALVSDIGESAKIDFIPKGQQTVQTTNISLSTHRELENIKSAKMIPLSNKSFDYQAKDNVGIMTIKTFNNAEGFREFIDKSFRKLAESKIDKLILDLRGNGGGEETNAIHLYSYLTTKPFKYYDRYEVNVQPNKKVNQESTLISYETLNFFADIVSKDTMGRNVITNFEPLEGRFLNPSDVQQPKQKNNFNGKVVVLIDGGSFSATSEICAIMQRDKRATLLGVETGGAFDGNTSGIYDQITLPNTRLKVTIPLVKYVISVGEAKFNFGRGVMPDYQIMEYHTNSGNLKNDRLINFAIGYLNKEK